MGSRQSQQAQQSEGTGGSLISTGGTSFDEKFPNLMREITNLNGLMSNGPQGHEQMEFNLGKILSVCNREIGRTIGGQWTTLLAQNKGYVARHTLMVLAITLSDPIFATLTEEEQEMAKWAALLHDVAKRSTPLIEGKDHIHPFRSAITVLEVCDRLGLISQQSGPGTSALIQQAIQLVRESVERLPPNEIPKSNEPGEHTFCLERHSHEHLDEVFSGNLWQACERGSFIDLVFRLVLFHQSLPVLADYPPKKPLSIAEIGKYCDDDRFFKLYELMVIADSCSYSNSQEAVDLKRNEINQSLRSIREQITSLQ